MARRLYRSRESSFIGGVCGGIGEYFDIDPVFVRIIAVLLLFADGIGLIAYIIAWIAIPARPEDVAVNPAPRTNFTQYLPGAILIALGIIFLANKTLWWFHFDYFWPLGLIAIGVFLIARSVRNHDEEEKVDETVES
ncbi:MAG: PspC domain-containing protein [candidate division Zixibacteria bacterium]|nr:PspC domain-containing protein [candidate division Zixibacteria bacterium]